MRQALRDLLLEGKLRHRGRCTVAVMDPARLQDCGSPRGLYRAPRTEFTVSFVGNAHVLPVTVGDGGVLFGGAELTVDTGAVGKGATATLCVPPHLVGLGDGERPATDRVRMTLA